MTSSAILIHVKELSCFCIKLSSSYLKSLNGVTPSYPLPILSVSVLSVILHMRYLSGPKLSFGPFGPFQEPWFPESYMALHLGHSAQGGGCLAYVKYSTLKFDMVRCPNWNVILSSNIWYGEIPKLKCHPQQLECRNCIVCCFFCTAMLVSMH